MVGPKNPYSPLGPAEVVCIDRADALLKRQEFIDGTLYVVEMKGGAPFDGVLNSVISAVPLGVWCNVHNPWDVQNYDDDSMYISIWSQAN